MLECASVIAMRVRKEMSSKGRKLKIFKHLALGCSVNITVKILTKLSELFNRSVEQLDCFSSGRSITMFTSSLARFQRDLG